MRFPSRVSPAWCAFFGVLFLRLLVSWARLDELKLERYTGNIAWGLLQGLPLEASRLPLISHNRGSMVVGFLAVPYLWLLGPSLLALKLLAVTFSAATAFVFVRLLERHAGRVAAWAGVLGIAFLPPSYLMVDVLVLGSHGETLLVSFGCLAILLGARTREGGIPSPRRALLLGLLFGFGAFTSFHFLVVLPALLLAWGALDPHFWKRARNAAFLLGAAATAAPAAFFLGREEEATDVINVPLDERLFPGGFGGAFEKALELLGGDLMQSWLFYAHGGAFAGWLFAAASALGLLAVGARVRRADPLAVYLLAYPVLLLGAFAATNFPLDVDDSLDGMGSRFLMPTLPCLAAWSALLAQACADRGHRLAAWLAALTGPLAGALGTLALCASGFPDQPPVRGTDFPWFKNFIERAGGRDLAERLAWVERLDGDWSEAAPMRYRAVRRPHRSWESLAAFEESVLRTTLGEVGGDALRPFLLVDLGRKCVDSPAVHDALRELRGPAGEGWALTWVFRGVGDRWVKAPPAPKGRPGRPASELDAPGHDPAGWREIGRRLDQLPPQHARHAAEGMGFALGVRLTPYDALTQRPLALAEELPAAHAPAFYRGLGWGYRMRFFEASYREPGPLRVEELLPAHARAAFREGLRAGGD